MLQALQAMGLIGHLPVLVRFSLVLIMRKLCTVLSLSLFFSVFCLDHYFLLLFFSAKLQLASQEPSFLAACLGECVLSTIQREKVAALDELANADCRD